MARPKKNRLKVPRASIAVTVLDDLDYMNLVQSSCGREAFGLFVALVASAKNQRNGGVFEGPDEVLALLVRWPVSAFKSALSALVSLPGRWVLRTAKGLVIRSFGKWNRGWGGHRSGSGRKPTGFQVDFKSAHLGDAPDTASATASRVKTSAPKAARMDPDTVEIPADLQGHADSIRAWFAYKAARRQGYKSTSLPALFKRMASLGDNLPEALERAQANNWQGFDFADRKPAGNNGRHFASAGTAASEGFGK